MCFLLSPPIFTWTCTPDLLSCSSKSFHYPAYFSVGLTWCSWILGEWNPSLQIKQYHRKNYKYVLVQAYNNERAWLWQFGSLVSSHHRGKRKQFLCLDSSNCFLHPCGEGGSAPPQPCQLQGHQGAAAPAPSLYECSRAQPPQPLWARRDLALQRTSTGLQTA